MMNPWHTTSRWVGAILSAVAVLASTPAYAGGSEKTQKLKVGQRYVSFGPTAGQFNGFGAGLRMGTQDVGVEAYAGWMPVLVSTQVEDSSPELDFFSSSQLSAHLYFAFLKPSPQASIGLLGGYKYNSLLRSAGTIGAYFHLDLTYSLALHVAGGAMYFPDGEDRVREEADVPDNAVFGFPGPSLQIAANAALLIYL